MVMNGSPLQEADRVATGLDSARRPVVGHRFPCHFHGRAASVGDVALCGTVKKLPGQRWRRGDPLCVVCVSLDPSLGS